MKTSILLACLCVAAPIAAAQSTLDLSVPLPFGSKGGTPKGAIITPGKGDAWPTEHPPLFLKGTPTPPRDEPKPEPLPHGGFG